MAKEAKRVQVELEANSIEDYLNLFASVAVTLGNNAWQNLAAAFESKAIEKFGSAASVVANSLLLSAIGFGIVFLATGTISFDKLTPVQQAQFISQCVSVVVLLIQKGIRSGVAYQATGSLWEAMKVFFGKEITSSQEAISSVFGRWIACNSNIPRPSDLEILFDGAVDYEAQFEAEYPRLTQAFGRNVEEFMATCFAAAMAVVGIVLSAIALANSKTPLDMTMNSLFLASATLDLVAAAAGWAVSLGIEAIGALSVAAIATAAGALAIAVAIAGVIILIVILTQHKNPPDPTVNFVNSAAVKNGGFFMEYETAIDYFQVVNDEKGKPHDLGVSMLPNGLKDLYLKVSSEGSLSLAPLIYDYSTVLSVSTDYQGQSLFLTKVWDAQGKTQVLALTLDDNKQLKMASTIDDDKKRTQQRWVAITNGDVTKDKGHLMAASFTIYNQYWGTKYYLSGRGKSVAVGPMPQNLILHMQPMKPEMLSFPNISLTTFNKDCCFYPFLLQVGSISGQIWSINPTIPEWLELDKDKGTISQKSGVAPPVYPQTNFTIVVKNDVGSASAQFYIQVIKTD